jgi:dimethylamine/trimethylamine dehydrogenase
MSPSSEASDASLEGDMLRQHLFSLGIVAHRDVVVTDVSPSGVRGEMFEQPWSMECGGVVLVTQQRSTDALYRDLHADPAALEAAGIEAVYAIGDAVAPRHISEAVFDGHRLAREIDGEDPMRPLPYLRERIAL